MQASHLLLYYSTVRGLNCTLNNAHDAAKEAFEKVILKDAASIALEELFDLELVQDRTTLPSLGRRIFIHVTESEQLDITILKSDTAVVKVREVILEIPAGKGGFVTVKDIIEEGIENIRSSASFAPEDLDTKEKEQLDSFLLKMEKFARGQEEFTLIIDDPLSRSFIDGKIDQGQFTLLICPSDNKAESVVIQEYQRTPAQNSEFDLDHVKVPFETQGTYAIDPFEVLDIDGLPFKEYQALFDLEKWYDALKDETFDTHFMPITREQAWAIVGLADRIKAEKEQDLQKDDEEEEVEKMANELKDSEIDAVIESFKEQVDKALSYFPEGAFIRLSTRSPKDAVQASEKYKKIIKEELGLSPTGEVDPNLDDIAFYRTCLKAMKLFSSLEVVGLLSTSFRAYNDLRRWLQFQNVADMSLFVRKWHWIDPSMEFRAFVYKGKLTAVSQYIYVCYFQNLVDNKEEVKKRIYKYFYNVIKEKLSPIYQSYVIDFALLEDREIVIEVNPFWNKTGPALFDWDEDRDVIANGTEDGSFEFRIVEKPWMRRRNFQLSIRTL